MDTLGRALSPCRVVVLMSRAYPWHSAVSIPVAECCIYLQGGGAEEQRIPLAECCIYLQSGGDEEQRIPVAECCIYLQSGGAEEQRIPLAECCRVSPTLASR